MTKTIIDLYEDNAGFLHLHQQGSDTVYEDLPVSTGPKFTDDAQAIAERNVSNWSKEWIWPYEDVQNDLQEANLIATWKDGTITVHKRPDRSGELFLGLKDCDTLTYPYTYTPHQV